MCPLHTFPAGYHPGVPSIVQDYYHASGCHPSEFISLKQRESKISEHFTQERESTPFSVLRLLLRTTLVLLDVTLFTENVPYSHYL